jgi:hypothetical protein
MIFESEKEIRQYIADTLDLRIKTVIETRLDEWFNTNIKEKIEKGIKEEFEKIMIVKLK